MHMISTRLLGATALATSLVLLPAATFAQTAPGGGRDGFVRTGADQQALSDQQTPTDAQVPATGPTASPASNPADVVVTGSRIRRPNVESNVPITSISGESLFQQGKTNIGDTLNDLPQLRSTFSQQNPALGVGIAGLNLLDLRGLDPKRTLVVVNGRRHVPADILNDAVSVDINTIPNDLIERVDIVTGGNSAVYGSDAVAGVVNFVLKRNFDGLQVRGQAGVSQPGGYGGNQYTSVLAGKNFAQGRGNITVDAEYAHQDRVYGSDVPFLRQVNGLGLVDADPASAVNGSDGNPDSIFLRNQTLRSINRFGLVPISQPATAPGCGVGVSNGIVPGVPYNCLFVFQPNNSLVPSTETARFSTGPIGGAIGGNLQTGREDKLLSVLPKQDRYNINLQAHYEFSKGLEAFVEAKFARIDTQGSNASASAIQGTFTQFDFRERVRLDNPFLSAASRTTVANAILASGCNTSLTVACTTARQTFTGGGGFVQGGSGPLNAADIAAINGGTYRFVVARNLADAGIRDERFRRDTFRVVGGFRGTFNTDWTYELSANYGRTTETTDTLGYFDKQRVDLSLDAGRNPVTGQIQCRSQFDPTAAVARTGASAGNIARLASDIAACVPYNPFGQSDNSGAVAYFTHPYHVDAHITQLDLTGFVSGDTSGFFNLPGGPLRFVLGGEYRREKAFYAQDDFGASGDSTAVAFGSFDPPPFTVKEAYGELQLPILRDKPFFHELTISGGARISKYQGSTGTVWTYNAGVDWAPFRDLRFRANYGRAIRAPNPTETFGELIPNFAPGFLDPCAPAQIATGTKYRAANCQAALGANLSNLASLGTYSLPILSGVNPDLQAEKSDSYTYGAVFQPHFVPGLALSVDYFNIRVKGVITALAAQQIVNSCYDQPTLSNPFCGLFQRFAGPGVGPFNELPGQVTGNTLVSAPFNFASRIRRGIDTNLSYQTSLGGAAHLTANLIYTHNIQDSNFENPSDPTFENVILKELGDPKDEFRLDTDLSFGPFTFGYRMRYIGPMYTGAYENFNSVGGRAPQNADASEPQQFPEVFYHDIRFEWDISRGRNGGGIGRNLNFFVGVDNILNTEPPLGVSGTGNATNDRTAGTAAIYDIRGRNFYAGFKARF